MYTTQDPHRGLETPPPASRFRRPWSPEPYDPAPSSSLSRYPEFRNQDDPQTSSSRNRGREPSDVSVEALDLADYARTLARNTNTHSYAPIHRSNYIEQQAHPFLPYDQYPPSPPPLRPFALASQDSLSPPSLLSPSASSAQSRSGSSSTRSFAPRHRPFSLPTPSLPQRSLQSHPSQTEYNNADGGRQGIYHGFKSEPEIDITQFPAFTRGWYAKRPELGSQEPYDPYSPSDSLYKGSNDPHKVSPFDPSYDTNNYPSPPPSYPHIPAHGSRSSRDANLFPWSADPPENQPPLDPEIKEERMRMLEREFGGKGKGKSFEDDEKVVGSVDGKGRILTEGPKKRLAVRWLQILLALMAGGASIYAGLAIKPSPPPPPAGKPPLYVLYVLSVLTFLFCTYFFLIYPSCCGARKASAPSNPYTSGPGGMMVLPVQGLPGKKGGKKKKKGKGGMPGDVQVNLIVDPSMFGGRPPAEDESEDASESEFGLPGSYTSSSRPGGRRRRGGGKRRRGIFEGLAVEAQWKRARKMLKWVMLVDVCGMVLWGSEFVFVLIGKRCPSGGFEGWCDAYNLSSAAACLLCVAFGFSTFFDIKDLHKSKSSPRTRT
ncbi:unnamed protein product [Somion occarium]|uniref:Uncharacterized protein n=1 Tax=Somion occarium TaxID=3059160 RepID=A0ABP1DBA8_9APHY